MTHELSKNKAIAQDNSQALSNAVTQILKKKSADTPALKEVNRVDREHEQYPKDAANAAGQELLALIAQSQKSPQANLFNQNTDLALSKATQMVL